MYAFLIYIINSQRDYKDSELYINRIAGAGKTHDVFYTDPELIVCPFLLLFLFIHGQFIFSVQNVMLIPL